MTQSGASATTAARPAARGRAAGRGGTRRTPHGEGSASHEYLLTGRHASLFRTQSPIQAKTDPFGRALPGLTALGPRLAGRSRARPASPAAASPRATASGRKRTGGSRQRGRRRAPAAVSLSHPAPRGAAAPGTRKSEVGRARAPPARAVCRPPACIRARALSGAERAGATPRDEMSAARSLANPPHTLAAACWGQRTPLETFAGGSIRM
eukprot:scaffold3768_cov376-Prasinococcus_capsulatus_cf.AAC.34